MGTDDIQCDNDNVWALIHAVEDASFAFLLDIRKHMYKAIEVLFVKWVWATTVT